MNFSPIKTKKRYEYTKFWIGIFEEQIKEMKKTYKKTNDFVAFAESIYYAKHIMEAEIQEYKRSNKKGSRKKCLNNG